MNLLKKIAVSAFLTASLSAVYTPAFSAEAHQDKGLVVLTAAKNTEAALLEAKSLLEKGGDTEQVLKAMNEARQAQKEFRYEQTERLRQKLNDKLSGARKAFENNDNAKALENINAALGYYADMKKIYDAAH
ncbi:MAG: hypothetical protein NTV43_05605 [Methylococcales bacterium]|nr:hypothetical protein [Methylococcales bacterium]